ncbi:hypothetical protein [Orenia marismortui]|uniref:hypothetical protein n=1 Tax=Orenia marismortui TaxID=46469 RepID=UPI00036BD532|nr:hypothetical protein [Orenia marismortui]
MSKSNNLLQLLYNEYCQKLKNGISEPKAKMFGSSKDIQKSIASQYSFEVVDELCRELDENNFLDVFYADNIAYNVQISDIGIDYAKNNL